MTEETENEETLTKTNEEAILREDESLKTALKAEQEKNLRLLAEMENLRKRLHKEKLEMNRFAVENVLLEILMPLDNFEGALGFTEKMSEETKHWAKGFEMILAQFKEILNHHNVKAIHCKGELFDPHKHEAVDVEETDELPEGTVTHEFLKGYQSGDRTLRPARVRVAKPLAKANKEENQKEEK